MTTTDIAPTFPPCPTWCPGHTGDHDKGRRTSDGRWTQACSAPALPPFQGQDGAYISVGWGVDTILTEPRSSWAYADLVGDLSQYYVREYSIQIDTMGQPSLSAADARMLASNLLTAAEQMERASRPFGEA